MKKRTLCATMYVALAFAAIVLALFALNALFPVARDGDTLRGYDGHMVTIGPFTWDQGANAYTFSINVQGGAPPLALLYDHMPPRGTLNGQTLDLTGGTTVISGISSIALGAANRLAFSFAPELSNRHFQMTLLGQAQAQRLAALCTAIVMVMLGMLMLMCVYGLSLYLAKRSEKYLMLFALYTGTLVLWMLPAASAGRAPLLADSAHLYNCAIVLGILMCAQLCDIRLKRPLDAAYKWYGAIPLTLAVAGLIKLLALPPHGMEVVRFALYLIEIAILIYSLARGRRECWILLAGILLGQAVRLLAIQTHLPFGHVSVAFLLIKYLRLGVFAFVLCLMMFTNLRFARKYREAEELAHRLDIKVHERTAQLVHQQEQRKKLVANISHDLRTPLFVMMGCLKRLKEGGGQGEVLEIAQSRLNYIARLVDDLFTAVKLDDRKLLLETEPMCLSGVVSSVVRAAALEGQERGVALDSAIGPGIMVWGDENRLSSVAQNLVANAVYYTQPGGHVGVALAAEGDRAVLTISDDGPGIPRDELDRVFERYYVVKRPGRSDSSGLGLSIARDIVKLHKGDMQVISDVGAGTRIRVELPIWRERRNE